MIHSVSAKLEQLGQGTTDDASLEQVVIGLVEQSFAADMIADDEKVEDAYAQVGFRDNYVRLKVGQGVYDEVLQSIETDILSQAILVQKTS